jgi:hypothetical protein
MSRLYVGIFVALAMAASAPAHAWGGRSKSLPKPRSFMDHKDDSSTRLSVLRSTPSRVQATNWGRSTFTDIAKSGRGVSAPHMSD